jgi:ATP-dependent helicase YprA (DUF1998 family)
MVPTADLPLHLAAENCILHTEVFEARPARYATPRAALPPALSSFLPPLYNHQAVALDALAGGHDVLCCTGTGSGKSLIFLIPTLCSYLSSEEASALFLFPTKALLNDQLLALEALLEKCPPALSSLVRARVLDGDTPFPERELISREANLLFATVDIVSAYLLPQHAQWARFLRGLQHVVLDELHVYRGVFGAGVAQTLSRLRRLCGHHRGPNGGALLYCTIACSATVSNPRQLFEALAGKPERGLCILDSEQDGSARGTKTLVVWQPPLAVVPVPQQQQQQQQLEKKKRPREEGGQGEASELARLLWESKARQASRKQELEEEDGEALSFLASPGSDLQSSTLALAASVSPALAAYLRCPTSMVLDVFGASLIPALGQPARDAEAVGRGSSSVGGGAAAATASDAAGGGVRRSAYEEAARLTLLLLGLGKSVIVFTRTRKIVDLLTEHIRAKLVAAREMGGGGGAASAGACSGAARLLPPPASVVPYRAGFPPHVRRATEAALRAGEVRAVVASNALELGIDVGALDCAVLLGHPGTSSSLWQQAGRVGRGAAVAGTAFLILTPTPLCRALSRTPAAHLRRPPEAAVVPFSAPTARAHLLAAAAELPITEAEVRAAAVAGAAAGGAGAAAGGGEPGASRVWGQDTALLLGKLFREGELVPEAPPSRRGRKGGGRESFVSRGWVPSAAARALHASLSLRGDTGRDFALMADGSGSSSSSGSGSGGGGGAPAPQPVETMEERRVRVECIAPPFSGPHAALRSIITSQGAFYAVEGVDWQRRRVQLTRLPPREATYYTRPLAFATVDVTGAPTARAPRGASRCLVRVTTSAMGITAVERGGGGGCMHVPSKATQSYTDAALPGVFWNVSVATLRALLDLEPPCHPLVALHAAAHALLHALPLHLLCDPADLDTEHVSSLSPLARPARVVLYEPRECGLARAACAVAPALVRSARELLQQCPCKDGCTECLLGAHSCTSMLGKRGALVVLGSFDST